MNGKFLLFNLVVCLAFPATIAVTYVALKTNGNTKDTLACVVAAAHFGVVATVLFRSKNGSRLILPSLATIAFLFLYNRHWTAQPDNSPFSDGVGTVDQRAFGMLAYLRVFDQRHHNWGNWYLDTLALACTIELAVFLTLLFGGLQWTLSDDDTHEGAR